MNSSLSKDWVASLQSTGAEQQLALTELRELLLGRLKRGLSAQGKVDDEFIEDAVQDAIVAILNALPDFQGRSRFTTWATTIAIRIAITEMRRRRWKDVSLNELLEKQGAEVGGVQSYGNPERGLIAQQMVGRLHELIDTVLTERQRTVLKAELMGMPQEEIGRRVGSNRNAIYKLVHDARKKLQHALIEAGYSKEDLANFRKTDQ